MEYYEKALIGDMHIAFSVWNIGKVIVVFGEHLGKS